MYKYKEIRFHKGDLEYLVKFDGGSVKYLSAYLTELSQEGWEFVTKISDDTIILRKKDK